MTAGLDAARADLDRVSRHYSTIAVQYRAVVNAAAVAEAAHKRARARKILELKARGEARSHADAECQAEADDDIADLYQARLVAAAEAEAFKERLRELREQQANARTVVVDERNVDRMHAHEEGLRGVA